MTAFSFNLMAHVVANLFIFPTKNDIVVHNNKLPNLGVYHTTFSNLKGPRAPSQNCKENEEIEENACIFLVILKLYLYYS